MSAQILVIGAGPGAVVTGAARGIGRFRGDALGDDQCKFDTLLALCSSLPAFYMNFMSRTDFNMKLGFCYGDELKGIALYFFSSYKPCKNLDHGRKDRISWKMT